MDVAQAYLIAADVLGLKAHQLPEYLTADFSVTDPYRMMRTDGSAEKSTRPIVQAWCVRVNINATGYHQNMSPEGSFRSQGVDVGEVAVGASEVDAVPHHKYVGHLKAHVLDRQIYLSARGLGEERADLQGGGLARKQGAPQVGEG